MRSVSSILRILPAAGMGLLIALGSATSATAATPSGSSSPGSTPTPASVGGSPTAPRLGVITVVPASGNDQTAFALITSKACPAGGTNVIGTILGPGLPDYGMNVVPNTTAALFPHTAANGLYMPSSNTVRNLVNELPDPQPLKGRYRLRVECRGPAKIADLGDFTGSMVWDGHHGYVADEPDVPASSLVTVAPRTDPPIPSAAPTSSGAAVPGAARPQAASPAATKKSGTSNLALWLVALGIVLTAGGLSTLVRGRRTAKRQRPSAARAATR